MSLLKQQNGDDYPEAANKHLQDGYVLLKGNRFDGAAYLAGYVVECAIKTLIQVETGSGVRSHEIVELQNTFSTLAAQFGARTSRFYIPLAAQLKNSEVLKWAPEMRYHSPAITKNSAGEMVQEANEIYGLVIGELILDGVI